MLPCFKMKQTYFGDQHYDSLKKEAQSRGELFCDTLFPADDSSLFYSHTKRFAREIEWKRPKELCENPRLFVDGACSCDVVQGMLGNCWFVAACSALAQEKSIWNKVIPDANKQEWNEEDPNQYAGIFRFSFWRFGTWIEVIIDDRLPTLDGELVYLRSREKNEFWGPLLEKAYAKLAGSYEALDGGNLHDALVDFTGGISETIELAQIDSDEAKTELFNTMKKEMERHSLMCAAITAASQEEMEMQTDVGLVKGHAYGITAVRRVPVGESAGLLSLFKDRERLSMIRLRNPWGGKEWRGRFSDTSEEWEQVSESEREKLGITFEEDGEFWMLFEDFCTFFSDISICRIVNTSILSFSKTWCEEVFYGKWNTDTKRAGGCLNHRATFLDNPQYRFDISGSKEDEVMISLMQEDCRALKKEGRSNLVIGFTIMKAELNRRYRVHSILQKVAGSDYMASRSVFLRNKAMPPGRYVLVPTTFTPGEDGNFLLRIFTDRASDARELTEDRPSPSIWPCMSFPCLVTVVRIISASGLIKQDTFGSADPYCIIKCEGERVRTPTLSNTLEPRWDQSAIFYRRSADSAIKVQVWNSNIVMDTCMGKAVFNPGGESKTEPQFHTLDLVGKASSGDQQPLGSIIISSVTSDDLSAF